MVSYKISRPFGKVMSVDIYDDADMWMRSVYSTKGTITVLDNYLLVLRDSAGFAIMFFPKSETTILDGDESEFGHLFKEE